MRSSGAQSPDSVGVCCFLQFGALAEFGLRVSCCPSIVFFLQIHHEPYRANSLPSKSICTRQDFPLTALPTRYTFPGCQHIASPCAREISFTSEGVRSAARTPFDGETGRKIADDAATSPGNVVAFLGCRTAGVAGGNGPRRCSLVVRSNQSSNKHSTIETISAITFCLVSTDVELFRIQPK